MTDALHRGLADKTAHARAVAVEVMDGVDILRSNHAVGSKVYELAHAVVVFGDVLDEVLRCLAPEKKG